MHSALMAGLSSLCLAVAVYLACQWYIPWIRLAVQKPVEPLLRRASELGFEVERLRTALFLTESGVLMALAWGGHVYLGSVLTITLFVISFHLRLLVLSCLVEKRERQLRAQTLVFVTGLTGLTRSGLSLGQAFASIANETPLPLGKHVQRVAMEHRRGRPLIESIAAARTHLRLDAFSLLATSVTCAIKHGAPLQASLAGVADSLRHRSDAERQLYARTSNARNTILILSATAPGFLIMFWYMMPDSIELIFNTPLGKKVLAIIMLLLYSGIAWARQLLALK